MSSKHEFFIMNSSDFMGEEVIFDLTGTANLYILIISIKCFSSHHETTKLGEMVCEITETYGRL
jgi:hypothetical protein